MYEPIEIFKGYDLKEGDLFVLRYMDAALEDAKVYRAVTVAGEYLIATVERKGRPYSREEPPGVSFSKDQTFWKVEPSRTWEDSPSLLGKHPAAPQILEAIEKLYYETIKSDGPQLSWPTNEVETAIGWHLLDEVAKQSQNDWQVRVSGNHKAGEKIVYFLQKCIEIGVLDLSDVYEQGEDYDQH